MEQNMTTNEFIELLKKNDPDGNKEVWLDGCFYGCPAQFVEIETDKTSLTIK